MTEEILVPEWWHPGNGMMYRRDALPTTHPESTYSYVRREYPDVDPTDFGIRAPETNENELMKKLKEYFGDAE